MALEVEVAGSKGNSRRLSDERYSNNKLLIGATKSTRNGDWCVTFRIGGSSVGFSVDDAEQLILELMGVIARSRDERAAEE